MEPHSEQLHKAIADSFVVLVEKVQHAETAQERTRSLEELRQLTHLAEALFQRRRVGENPPD